MFGLPAQPHGYAKFGSEVMTHPPQLPQVSPYSSSGKKNLLGPRLPYSLRRDLAHASHTKHGPASSCVAMNAAGFLQLSQQGRTKRGSQPSPSACHSASSFVSVSFPIVFLFCLLLFLEDRNIFCPSCFRGRLSRSL